MQTSTEKRLRCGESDFGEEDEGEAPGGGRCLWGGKLPGGSSVPKAGYAGPRPPVGAAMYTGVASWGRSEGTVCKEVSYSELALPIWAALGGQTYFPVGCPTDRAHTRLHTP